MGRAGGHLPSYGEGRACLGGESLEVGGRGRGLGGGEEGVSRDGVVAAAGVIAVVVVVMMMVGVLE